MLNGFHQVSIYSLTARKIIFERLAYNVSLSPDQEEIAYQTYEPPHGGKTPFVQIEVVSTRGPAIGSPPQPRTIFGPDPNEQNREVPQSEGQSLCSAGVFWSQNEQWVGFCILDQPEVTERVILASSRPGGESLLVKRIDSNELCDQMNQGRSVRCTLFIKKIDVGSTAVNLVLRSMGARGYQEEQINYPLNIFSALTVKGTPSSD